MSDVPADDPVQGDQRSDLSYEEEVLLRRQIEDYYLPRQLVDAIAEFGKIPDVSDETLIGIGFLDIADYSYLSKFLSPHENQSVLNGLYSAFNWVLKKHGGYLNKIEGDSIMFHYGGPIDPQVRGMEKELVDRYIARELFNTCIELQRICSLFNQANENILSQMPEGDTVDAVLRAYEIIKALRNSYDMSAAFNALFQIRVRIGASLGNVLIGNFGPEGSKHWDVIGLPVIDAKRMEASAPIGGLRVTASYYEKLKQSGVLKEYYERFRREAKALSSVYEGITEEELFRYGVVFLKDKKNAEFKTYSVQVNPSLPEDITAQARLLLQRGDLGASRIVEFIKYYRGNRFVINAMESLFEESRILIRKESLLQIMIPDRYKKLLMDMDGDVGRVREALRKKYSLYGLLEILGKLQDSVKRRDFTPESDDGVFKGYDAWVANHRSEVRRSYAHNKGGTHKSYYFYNVIFPLFFDHIKASILEYQDRLDQITAL